MQSASKVSDLREGGEGHRGKMIALRVDGTSAIVLAMTSSLNVYDGVQWGRFYQVEETGGPAEYPRVLRRVESIPEMKEWRIV